MKLTTDEVSASVYSILRARSPGVDLTHDLPLGAGGLGLDSIALVEVLLECEEVFAADLATETLAADPLTVGALIERVALTRSR